MIKFLPHILIGLVVISALWMINHWRVEAGKVGGLESTISELEVKLTAKDEKIKENQLITEKNGQYYEDEITKRDADLKRVRSQTRCVVPSSTANSGYAGNKPDQQGQRNGVTTEALYDFAGACETDRIKVITLQRFIKDVWNAK